jgi:cytochrome P450
MLLVMFSRDALDPFPWYAQMRAASPVAEDADTGSWHVFGYEDVKTVLSDHARFSSNFALAGGDGSEGDGDSALGASVIATDPPRHRQLRNLVTQAFTPRAVEAMRPRISQIVDDLLAPIGAGGRMDVIADLAYPLPVIVIAEMLGVPASDREKFKRWSDEVVSTSADPENIEVGDAHYEMGAYFYELLQERRADPRNDLVSALAAAEIDGQRLTEVELIGFCMLLLVAGNETTTNLIANAVLCLDRNPEAARDLRADPDLVPSAIEESLRYLSPVQSMFRVARDDVEVRGVRIPAYSRLVAWIGSANRDPSQFPDADRFDIRRSPNRHLAFGQGIHFCIGAPLARLEARIALTAMLTRLGHASVEPGVDLRALPSTIVYGVKSLPVTFAPGRAA